MSVRPAAACRRSTTGRISGAAHSRNWAIAAPSSSRMLENSCPSSSCSVRASCRRSSSRARFRVRRQLAQPAARLAQPLLQILALGDVAVVPHVNDRARAVDHGNVVAIEHAPIDQAELVLELRLPFAPEPRGHRARRRDIVDQDRPQRFAQLIRAAADQPRRRRQIEHAAERLVGDGDPAVLALCEDAVLDVGNQHLQERGVAIALRLELLLPRDIAQHAFDGDDASGLVPDRHAKDLGPDDARVAAPAQEHAACAVARIAEELLEQRAILFDDEIERDVGIAVERLRRPAQDRFGRGSHVTGTRGPATAGSGTRPHQIATLLRSVAVHPDRGSSGYVVASRNSPAHAMNLS